MADVAKPGACATDLADATLKQSERARDVAWACVLLRPPGDFYRMEAIVFGSKQVTARAWILATTAGLYACTLNPEQDNPRTNHLETYGAAGVGVESVDDEPAATPDVAQEIGGPDGHAAASIPEQEFAALDRALDSNPADPEAIAWKARLNAKADALAGIFMAIPAGSGRVVKFYQSGDTSMVGEFGRIGVERALKNVQFTTFADVYQHLRPLDEVPAKVLEADLRMASVAPSQAEADDTAPEVTPHGDPNAWVPKHVTSSCAHFKDGHVSCPRSDTFWCVCDLRGDTGGSRSNVTHSWNRVASFNGSVTYSLERVGSSNPGPFTFAVAHGETLTVTMTNGTCRSCNLFGCGSINLCKRTHRSRVFNAAGNDYHWGACFDRDNNLACP